MWTCLFWMRWVFSAEAAVKKVILNQVIDRRLSSMRPVGILTNLNYESLKETLGMRILDRLQMDGGMWVNFEWDSYRKNVRHMRVVK